MASGVDDVLALLLAFSASSEDLQVALISVTYGNVPVERYVQFRRKNDRFSLY